MQCFCLKLRPRARALISIPLSLHLDLMESSRMSARNVSIWGKKKKQHWKLLNKSFFRYSSSFTHVNERRSARPDSIWLCKALRKITNSENHGFGGNSRRQPFSAFSIFHVLIAHKVLIRTSVQPIWLFSHYIHCHVTGWGHLCVYKIRGMNRLPMDLEAGFVTSVRF